VTPRNVIIDCSMPRNRVWFGTCCCATNEIQWMKLVSVKLFANTLDEVALFWALNNDGE
jgi:hypothetical protein